MQAVIRGATVLNTKFHKLSMTLLLLGSLFASASASFAQSAEMSEEALAKKAQNDLQHDQSAVAEQHRL